MKILLDVSFLGTAYCGYQVQPNLPTVQQQLNIVAKTIFGKDCDIIGCSRTDSGVHANHFFATVSEKGKGTLDTNVPLRKLVGAFNSHLPRDISINSVKEVDDSFHPRYDVRYKEYLYLLWNSEVRNPFMENRVWHYPRPFDETAIENMNKAANRIIGTHDFSTYMASNSGVKNTVRTVFDAKLKKDGNMVEFRISADGFLYNMVRILMGTLVLVGEGKISHDDIDKITESHNRAFAGITAPPYGLYLNEVVY